MLLYDGATSPPYSLHLPRKVGLVILGHVDCHALSAEHRAAVPGVGHDDDVGAHAGHDRGAAHAVRAGVPRGEGLCRGVVGEGLQLAKRRRVGQHFVHSVERLDEGRGHVLAGTASHFLRQVSLAEARHVLTAMPVQHAEEPRVPPVGGRLPAERGPYRRDGEVRVLHAISPALHAAVAPCEAGLREDAVAGVLVGHGTGEQLPHPLAAEAARPDT
mmetsp:Transcript_100761/g.260361  ORF Transcript_100761/g.260361 Transcript_100761/m.260361 type:complete len:216 (+) Transcript_100761:553-1200(+)